MASFRESRVPIRRNFKWLPFRMDLMAVLDWDLPLALVCQAFINWHDWRYGQLNDNAYHTKEPWVYLSRQTIRDSVIGGISARTIDRCVKELIDRGILKTRDIQHIGDTREYLLDEDALLALIDAVPADVEVAGPTHRGPVRKFAHEDEEDTVRRFAYEPCADLRTADEISRAQICAVKEILIGTLNNNQTEQQSGPARPTTLSIRVNETVAESYAADSGVDNSNSFIPREGFSPETEGGDCSLDDVKPEELPELELPAHLPLAPPPFPLHGPAKSLEVAGTAPGEIADEPLDPEAFIRAYHRFRGVKKMAPRNPDRVYAEERLELAAKDGVTQEYAIACLDAFMESEWAQANKFPIRALVKDLDKWYPAAPRGGNVPPRDSRPSGGPVIPPNRTSASAWAIAEEWNSLVKAAPKVDPCTLPRTPGYAEATVNLDLRSRFGELAAKADACYASGVDMGFVNLPWLLKAKEGFTKKNWERLLDGEFDFKLKAAKTATPVGDCFAAARANIMAKYGFAS